MDMRNPEDGLITALKSAASKDMPSIITGKDYDGNTITRRPELNELEYYLFPQEWSTTGLGFSGGVAGQAFTTADTIVITGVSGSAAVYFGGRFAYLVKNPNQTFHEDLERHRMVEQSKAQRYEQKSV